MNTTTKRGHEALCGTAFYGSPASIHDLYTDVTGYQSQPESASTESLKSVQALRIKAAPKYDECVCTLYPTCVCNQGRKREA